MNQNKLNKDQIQKLVLSTIGFVVLVYVYFSFFLGPLNRGAAAAEKSITDLQAKLASSKNEMMKATNLEKQATEAAERFAAFEASSPEGAPIAWFPPRMKVFFTNQQIEKSSVRLESSNPYKEPELENWTRYAWSIELPQTDFVTLGKALAQLENTEPLLSVTRLSIKAMADDPQYQQVNLTANTAILKR